MLILQRVIETTIAYVVDVIRLALISLAMSLVTAIPWAAYAIYMGWLD